MNKRFLISIVACLVVTTTSSLSAQANPLRYNAQPAYQNSSQHGATENSYQPESAIAQQPPVNTQQQVSGQQLSTQHRARTVQLQAVPQPQGTSSGQTTVPNDFQMPDAVFQAAFNQPLQKSPPTTDVVTEPIGRPRNNLAPLAQMINSLPDQDDASSPATANRSPQPAYQGQLDIRPEIPALDSATMSDQESPIEGDPATPPHEKKFDSQKFMKLIQRLAINTGIVMCFGVGFIFVAKLYFKTKGTHSGGGRSTPKAEFEIKSTLKLSPKSNLHLVEAGDHRLIVAIDQNGIKSVVPLSDSFANTLDGLEDLNGFSELLNSGAAPIQAASPPTPAVPANQAGAYSLATVAQNQPTLPATEQRSLRQRRDEMRAARQAQQTTPERKQQNEDAIRKKMEEALLDQGLKDVILNTLANRQVNA